VFFSNRLTGIGRASCSAPVSARASRSSATCRMRTPIFIFSRLERSGAPRGLAIALLFGTFVWLGFRIFARQCAGSVRPAAGDGISVMIGLSGGGCISGVTLAVIPATGVTLPFMSNGRSS